MSSKKTTMKKAAPKAKKKAKRKSGRKAVKVASAAAILGYKPVKTARQASNWRPNNSTKIKAQWKKYYDVLLDLRVQLLHQMSDLKKESAEEMSNYSMHMADAGTDNFDRDSALSLLSSDQDAVYEIEEALRRIERDAFGVCELTDKPIPKMRLAAIPWTRFSVDAQAKLERDGALQRRKIGSLGSVGGTSGSFETSSAAKKKKKPDTTEPEPDKVKKPTMAKKKPAKAKKKPAKKNKSGK